MPGFSDYLEVAVLNWLAKRTAFPSVPSNLFISLHNTDPEGAGGGELTTTANADGFSGGYQRVSVPTDLNSGTNANWSALSAGTPSTAQKVTNVNQITFQTATSAWNQAAGGGGAGAARAIQYFGIWDAAGPGTGNFLGGGQITPAGVGVTIQNGQTAIFGAGQLTLQVD